MWGRRKRRRTRLSRQLALGMLEDAMVRVEEQQHVEQRESEDATPDEAGQAEATPAPAPPPAEAAPPAVTEPPLVPRQPGSNSAPDDAHTTPT